ncbi:creatininase family protein [Kerstersia sp.]|uniref:creatininase family protein n=1 Tax=Kerstersia sp. TaxID=1930783 RepID=UPI003F8E41A5
MKNLCTSADIASRQPRFALIPIGAFEQHGPHLPVTTDTLIAQAIGQAVCARANGLLVSPITVSCSHEHAGFAGTVSVSATTLAMQVNDMADSLERAGFTLVVVLNCHGGNYVLSNVAQERNLGRPHLLLLPARQHWEAAVAYAGVESSPSADMHGGEIETSLLLHLQPQAVRTDLIRDHAAPQRPLLTFHGMRHYAEQGIIGFPSRATAEKGRLLLEKMAELLAQEIVLCLAPASARPNPDCP